MDLPSGGMEMAVRDTIECACADANPNPIFNREAQWIVFLMAGFLNKP
jgi:hypothetical protein